MHCNNSMTRILIRAEYEGRRVAVVAEHENACAAWALAWNRASVVLQVPNTIEAMERVIIKGEVQWTR